MSSKNESDKNENLKKLQEELNKFSGEVSEKTRELWLVGLGALSVAEKEGSRIFKDFLDRGKDLVDKGEELEQKGKDFANEQKDVLTRQFNEAAGFFQEQITKVKNAFDNNTANEEVQKLTETVEQLTAKVAELSKKLNNTPKNK